MADKRSPPAVTEAAKATASGSPVVVQGAIGMGTANAPVVTQAAIGVGTANVPARPLRYLLSDWSLRLELVQRRMQLERDLPLLMGLHSDWCGIAWYGTPCIPFNVAVSQSAGVGEAEGCRFTLDDAGEHRDCRGHGEDALRSGVAHQTSGLHLVMPMFIRPM